MTGMIKVLIFLILLMLFFWCLNMYRHIKSGNWKGFRRVVDITGVLFIAVLSVMLIITIL